MLAPMEASEQLARRSQGLCGEEYERCDALKILWNNEVGAGFEVLQTFDSSNSGTYRDHARGLAARTCGHCTESAFANLAGPLPCPSTAVKLLNPLRLVSRLPVPSALWRAERNIVDVPLDANPRQLRLSG
ncbi:MAG: hypothetical protein DMG62_01280 [Acidobacteria bacterium]|nr:MAG: hypothetical protein DMG63_19230 [Acidobacteriota bacterium]PYY24757.1 MAG: hypothetical protein DMG62_01280 [Acidobacteriota bacterium]